MLESKYILSAVNAFYADKLAEKKYTDNLKEIAAEKNSEYSKIKYELRALKIDRQKAEFSSDADKINELTAKIDDLSAKFNALKQKLFPLSESLPDCPICSDTGSVGNKPCICYNKRIIKECYSFLGVHNFALHSFKDDTLSESAGHKKEFDLVRRYAAKLPDTDKNLLITGQKGTGKTFVCECLVNAAADKGLCAVMISAFALNNLFAKHITSAIADKITFNEILSTCDLLVIDDLGAEPLFNKITVENLTAIVSERLINKKPFVITTNLTLGEISSRYGERAFSRLCGKQTVIFEMNGKDLRLN